MLKYTNDVLRDIEKRLEGNKRFSRYYYSLSKTADTSGSLINADLLKRKSDRISECMNLWLWDKYDENKLLDLVKVNRCMDKFCSNCRTLSIANVIHNFRPKFTEMLLRGYKPFLMTLTVPNVNGDFLESTINRMNQSFNKFFKWFNHPIGAGKKGFASRYIEFKACIKVLEINVQASDHSMYHPHFHCLIFVDEEEFIDKQDDFEKYIIGAYSRKRKERDFYSVIDVHIQQLWHMAYNNVPLSKFKNYTDLWYELYQADIRPMTNEKGLYEVFKYTFKDKDIYSLENFRVLFYALYCKRIRQGYGELYNLNLEEETGEKMELFLEIEEDPQRLLTKEVHELYTVYQEFEKISRFKAYDKEVFDKIK